MTASAKASTRSKQKSSWKEQKWGVLLNRNFVNKVLGKTEMPQKSDVYITSGDVSSSFCHIETTPQRRQLKKAQRQKCLHKWIEQKKWKMDIEKHMLSSGKSIIIKEKTTDNSNKYSRRENCLVMSINNAIEHLP